MSSSAPERKAPLASESPVGPAVVPIVPIDEVASVENPKVRAVLANTSGGSEGIYLPATAPGGLGVVLGGPGRDPIQVVPARQPDPEPISGRSLGETETHLHLTFFTRGAQLALWVPKAALDSVIREEVRLQVEPAQVPNEDRTGIWLAPGAKVLTGESRDELIWVSHEGPGTLLTGWVSRKLVGKSYEYNKQSATMKRWYADNNSPQMVPRKGNTLSLSAVPAGRPLATVEINYRVAVLDKQGKYALIERVAARSKMVGWVRRSDIRKPRPPSGDGVGVEGGVMGGVGRPPVEGNFLPKNSCLYDHADFGRLVGMATDDMPISKNAPEPLTIQINIGDRDVVLYAHKLDGEYERCSTRDW